MKMDFHRDNRRRLITPLAAALVLSLLMGGRLAAQEAPTPTPPGASQTSPAGQSDEERAVSPRKGGVESSPIGKGSHSQGAWGFVQTLGALAIVVGLIFLASWLLRRAGGRQVGGGQDVMQIVARKSISARQQLLLVRLGQRLVLVGSSGGALATLSEITDPAEVAGMLESVQAGQGSFAALLRGKIAKRGAGGTPVRAVSSSLQSAPGEREETHGQDAHATGGDKP
jgi:flagellar protein FliO/FliZ